MAGPVGRDSGALTVPVALRYAWLLPAAFLIAFLLVPVAVLIGVVADTETLAGLADLELWRVAAAAAAQAFVSVVLTLVIGIPITGLLYRCNFPGRRGLLALATVPFVLPTVVVALALRTLLDPVVDQGLALIMIAHAYVNLAVVIRIVGARWSRVDPRTVAVARTLGASPLTALRTVTLPALTSSIGAAASVVFVFSFTSLGIIAVAGDGTVRTLESVIVRRTSVLLDFPSAASAAIVQVLVVTLVIVATLRMRSARSSGRTWVPRTAARQATRIGVRAAAILVAAVLIAPLATMAVASVRVDGDWTITWWSDLLTGSIGVGSPRDALVRSLGIALATGVLASVVGGLAGVSALAHRTGRTVAGVGLLPLGVSAATLGVGTLLAFGRDPVDLRATGLLIPIAHALVAVPLVIAVAAPALTATSSHHGLVAATLGARPFRAWWTCFGPVLRVVMIAAGGLAAAVSLGDFGAASVLARADSPTVPVLIERLLGRPGDASFGIAACLSVVLMAVTLVLVGLIDRLGRQRGVAV
jgi:thiamine transport system permease protein